MENVLDEKTVWANLKIIASHTPEIGWVKDVLQNKSADKQFQHFEESAQVRFYFKDDVNGKHWADILLVDAELFKMDKKALEQYFSALDLAKQKEAKALDNQKREREIQEFQNKYKALETK